LDQSLTKDYALYQGDCVSVLRQLPAGCVDFSIYSPPFANLFIYSDSMADMGNATSDSEFFDHYGYLVAELTRLLRPGRLIAVHCSDLPYVKWRDGRIGIKDFSGMLIRAHEAHGHTLHSRVTLWKSPVTEMQRNKSIGLLYKQLRKDSIKSRQGFPDYLLVFRVPGENDKPVTHTPESFPLAQWQEWASPVWTTIDWYNTLNRELAREESDERHIAPLQLDLIERALVLWSTRGDTVLSPFAGIGSEGYVSVQQKRRFIGTELKQSYYREACKFLARAVTAGSAGSLLDLDTQAPPKLTKPTLKRTAT
jgi:DNA modification methylase